MNRFPHGVSSFGNVLDGIGMGSGFGNTYYVCQQTSAAWYKKWLDNHSLVYDDGSVSCHTTIQSAVNATTNNRGDVILLAPDVNDYDLAETVTINKNRIVIACPQNIIPGGYCGTQLRIHNAGDFAAFTITATASVTIAGLFFRETVSSGDDYPIIDVQAGAQVWGISLLNNWFGAATGASGHATKGIVNFGDTGGDHNIINNMISIYNPTDSKTVAALLRFAAQVQGCIIKENWFHTGSHATTVTNAISMEGSSYNNFITGNHIHESTMGTCILTYGITAGDDHVADNRISIAAANLANAVNGGTANRTFVNNRCSNLGGNDTDLV